MTREAYLQRLRRALAGRVSGEELERMVGYYAACLDEAGPQGEEALMAEWGEPEELAGRLRAAAGHRRPGRWARVGITAGLCAALALSVALGVWYLGRSGSRGVETAAGDTAAEAGPDGSFTLTEPYSAVDIEVDVGNVALIQSGTDYACDLSWSGADYTLEAWVENGTLVVQGNRSGGIHLMAEDVSAWIEITVPEGTDLTGLEAYTGLGDVTLTGGENGLNTGRLDVTADMGDVTLSGLNAEETALTLDLGELAAEDCTWGDTDVDSAGGNVTLTRLKAGALDCALDLGGLELTEVAAGPVDLEVGMGSVTAEGCTLADGTVTCDGGDVDLAGALTGVWDVENAMGSVAFTTSAAAGTWGWDLENDLGRVWVDGQDQGTRDSAQGGPNFLTARADLGDITFSWAE